MRKIYIAAIVFVMALSLTACKKGDDKETTASFDDKVNETLEETKEIVQETMETETSETAEAEKETKPQEESKKEPPVLIADGDKRLTEDEMKKYAQYFSEYGTWYSQALTSFYDSAKQVDLWAFFYNGLGIDGHNKEDLTQEEKDFLRATCNDFDKEWMNVFRVPVSEIDKVLQTYFGISYEACAKVGTEYLKYREESDSFYVCCSSTNDVKMTPYAGVKRPNGNIILFYEHELGGYAMITVKPVDGGLRIVANQKVSTGK